MTLSSDICVYCFALKQYRSYWVKYWASFDNFKN